jgi:hypothetical protein
MLPDLCGALDVYRPQLLIHDTSELAGPIAATAAGVPYVNHSFGHLLPEDLAALAADWVAPLWKRIGHDPPPLAGLYRHLYLDICPTRDSDHGEHVQQFPGPSRVARLRDDMREQHVRGSERAGEPPSYAVRPRMAHRAE